MAKDNIELLLEGGEEDRGWIDFRRRPPETYISHFAEKLDAFVDLTTNRRGFSRAKRDYLLSEAMTRSDFPLLLGTVLDRSLIARYRVQAPDWRTYGRVGGVRDFRLADRFKIWGAESALERVNEKGEFRESALSEAKYSTQVFKYGRVVDFAWETLVNDDLGAFTAIPDRFARAAARLEWRVATSAFVASTGPHTGLFGAPIVDVDGVSVTNLGALPLTMDNLATTWTAFTKLVDAEGEPIDVIGVHLVVPPALWLKARQIIQSAFQQVATGETAATVYIPVNNIVGQLPITLHLNQYLPIIDTSANRDRTWYMFANPADGPAFEVTFLDGFQAPQIVMKASDKASAGGGTLSPFEGDFHSDNVKYRVRHIIGATRLDPRFAYAQVSPT